MAHKSMRRWRVNYDLAYDCGGSGPWIGYYRTKLWALIALRYNKHFASWGGTARLIDQYEEL